GGGSGSLGEGQTREVTLIFTPASEGLRAATLTVSSNALEGPQYVALSGVGKKLPAQSWDGTWAIQPSPGHAVSITVDAQNNYTMWAVSADRQSVANTVQGTLEADGSFNGSSADGSMLFRGQIKTDRSSATITVERLGSTLLTVTAPRLADAGPLPAALV